MENKLTPELIEKARQAKSADELLSLAKENEIEITEIEAKAYFEQLTKSGELPDEELDNVAGGGCYYGDGRLVVTAGYWCKHFTCKYCHKVLSINHFCQEAGAGKDIGYHCSNCEYKTNKGVRMLCNHPDNYKR